MTYDETVDHVISDGLAEDVAGGDVTSAATIPADRRAAATLVVKEPGVVAGLDVARRVFARVDSTIAFAAVGGDGDRIDAPPQAVARLEGPARSLLTGERLALNLMQRMSGIATTTARYVDAVAGTGCAILDTRKTAPGLRLLDKRAVAIGGGTNHRIGLYDAILIKDNHVAVAGGIGAAIEAARAYAPDLAIEIETTSLAQVADALAHRPDTIMFDNMSPTLMREAVGLVDGRARTEASGGITLDTIRAVAETGVDSISVGALTHSVRALDISLEVVL